MSHFGLGAGSVDSSASATAGATEASQVRSVALLIDALLLGVSLVCVFRVLMFVASLLCVLFWEPAVCVLLVAAQGDEGDRS